MACISVVRSYMIETSKEVEVTEEELLLIKERGEGYKDVVKRLLQDEPEAMLEDLVWLGTYFFDMAHPEREPILEID